MGSYQIGYLEVPAFDAEPPWWNSKTLAVGFRRVRPPRPLPDALFVAACCLASLALKLWANAGRVTAVRGDTAYYFHVAKNLFAGRGFVCDYVWSYLENPAGTVPAPSHSWWMPGPSIVAALGMWVAGEASYTAAKVAMSILTSLFPAVVWVTALRCAREPGLARRAALLAVAFHPFVDQPAAPLSHGPYGVLVGFALAHLCGGPLTNRGGALLGALIGLAHYFRGDALTLFGTAGLLQLWHARRAGFGAAAKPLGLALIIYVAVLAPWFARNVAVYGRPMPEGPSRALYMRDYFDWFALPDRLTAERYSSAGMEVLLAEKFQQTGKCAWSFVASYFDPTLPNYPGSVAESTRSLIEWCANPVVGPVNTNPPPWLFLRHASLAMAVLTFVGLAGLALRTRTQHESARWLAVYGLHSAAEIVFYAWIFTAVSNQSYVSSMYALYPLFVVGMAAVVNPLEMLGIGGAGGAARAFRALGWTLTMLLFAANALGVGAYLRGYKGPEYVRLYNAYREFGVKLREAGFDPAKDRLMMQSTWDLYDADPIPVVRTPDEPLPRILATAERLGARWLVVEDEPPEAVRRAVTRPYRLHVFRVFHDTARFSVAFRSDTLRLSAVRILP